MAETKEHFADVSVKRLAKIYGEALLNAAEQANAVPQVLEEIDSLIDDVLRVDKRLEALLSGAAVGRKVRKEAIEKVFASRAHPTLYKFLLVLNDHDRLDLIPAVRQAAHELADHRARRVRAHIYSAIDLPEEYQAIIKERIQTALNLEPVLELHTDPTLLGGLKVRIGDTVFDATVRTRIDNLRVQLIARSSHEIQSRRDRFSSAE